MNVIKVRKVTSLTLLVSWVLSFVSGFILFIKSTATLYWLVPVDAAIISTLHTYSSFVMAGASIMHIYLNKNAIMQYLRSLKK